jgi:hypothetical protein
MSFRWLGPEPNGVAGDRLAPPRVERFEGRE